ncbi:unnamed protein product [Larinioides sclopetarius]|uniref:Uncharacterized protein n=1 Tax=Larinioides sclopetarius TaxID=280406 RepID=A0AAV1ZF81_9ARAC
MEALEDRMLGNIFQNSSVHDSEFHTLYFKAGRKLLEFEDKSNAEYLNRYYKIFRNYFNVFFIIHLNPDHPDHDSDTVKLLKESLYYRIIYVLKNSPILSSAVAFHFQNVLKEDFSYTKRIIKKEIIKICSVGGGAASDVVAVVKILDSLANAMDKQLDFRITVLDSDVNWKITCLTVLSCLKNFHGATWKINFVQVDISDRKNYSTEVIKSIQEADIILMAMLLLDFKNTNLDPMETTKNVSELMKCKSMFFLLDYSLIEYIRYCFGLSGETKNLHLIYENLSDIHVSVEAENFFERYKKHFTNLRCNSYIPVFVRAWVKTSTREISGTSRDLLHRYKKSIEIHDLKPIFLELGFFENWLIKYANRKRKAVQSERFIKEILQEKRQRRIFFMNKLSESKERLESARKKLIGEDVGEQHGTDEIDEEAWEKFVGQKKECSQVKRYAYESLIFDKELPDFFNK